MKRALLVLGLVVSVTGCGGNTDSTQPVKNNAQLNQSVRRAIMHDANMSVNAQNVYIDSNNGTITLRGAVDDPAERERVLELARGVEGVSRVNDELEVLNKSVATVKSEPVR